jgi:NAD(P)-dependent dehydrogenase (short-subunit alcohol dehydrogenase family)
MKLSGKTAIVTGARRGIGRVIALTLAQEGASVVVSDVDEKDCQKVVDEIAAAGGKATAVKCDVSVKSEVQNMVEKAVSEYGKVDILVNNAAVGVIKHMLRFTEDDWDKVIAVNLKGTFLCSQATAKNMVKNNGGRIINISSVASGGGGGATSMMTSYIASKGGIKALTEAMALDLASFGINVNAICPGSIDSGVLPESMKERSLKTVPKGRLGKPEDIAGLVLFLASPESDYMTGTTVIMDGGASRLSL